MQSSTASLWTISLPWISIWLRIHTNVTFVRFDLSQRRWSWISGIWWLDGVPYELLLEWVSSSPTTPQHLRESYLIARVYQRPFERRQSPLCICWGPAWGARNTSTAMSALYNAHVVLSDSREMDPLEEHQGSRGWKGCNKRVKQINTRVLLHSACDLQRGNHNTSHNWESEEDRVVLCTTCPINRKQVRLISCYQTHVG